jgi:hypothetical protein
MPIDVFLKQNLAKSGCFIATASCGDPFAPEVIVLTAFRDGVLAQNRIGRAFVRFYYTLSPPIADVIADSAALQRAAKCLLVRPGAWLVQRMWMRRVFP